MSEWLIERANEWDCVCSFPSFCSSDLKRCHMLFLIFFFCICSVSPFCLFFKKGKKKDLLGLVCLCFSLCKYLHSLSFSARLFKTCSASFPTRQYLAPYVCGVVLRFATKLTVKRSQKNNKQQQQIHAPGYRFQRPTTPDTHQDLRFFFFFS